jgi:hypothetical protein
LNSASLVLVFIGVALLLGGSSALAQIEVYRDVPCCNLDESSGVVWVGNDPEMTLEELASFCGPILWFSPDEPLLRRVRRPTDIDIPMAFPFEDSSAAPVVYYRVRTIITRDEGRAFQADSTDLNNSIVDLSHISGIDLDYFFYYPSEEGLGGHVHDVESVEMKIAVFHQPDCDECRYGISVQVVTAKAHGIQWYDNTLEIDRDAIFPMTIMVEEGKHASCTDKNGDGYFTPGYDVNQRINDAWGVRDVMRTGALFSGGFESWFAKVREPQHRVFPPLPEDSPVWADFVLNRAEVDEYAEYSVRPWPTVEAALTLEDPSIIRFVDKGHHQWPEVVEDTGLRDLEKWVDTETFAKSLSIAFRIDNDLGFSFVFPLFIFKNFNDPVTGGWLVNRIYLKDEKLRDFGWNIMYTTSASRWVDGYFSAGVEWDKEDDVKTQSDLITEAGLKFRFNVAHSPLGMLSKLTDFWGVRAGIRYKRFKYFTDIGYVIEIGAGTF